MPAKARGVVNKRPTKRHHTERFRSEFMWPERWTNAKAATVGFWLGQHKSSVDVALILRDGTSAATIRALIRKWRLPMEEARRGFLVEVTPYKRKLLNRQAEKLGITPEEFLRRVCDCVIGDKLYEAVTDGRFDDKSTVAA